MRQKMQEAAHVGPFGQAPPLVRAQRLQKGFVIHRRQICPLIVALASVSGAARLFSRFAFTFGLRSLARFFIDLEAIFINLAHNRVAVPRAYEVVIQHEFFAIAT